MFWIVAFVIAAGLFVRGSLPLLAAIFMETLPAWGLGLIFGLLVFFLLRRQMLHTVRSPEVLARLVNLNFHPPELSYSIEDREVRKYVDTAMPYRVAFFTSGVVAALALSFLFITGVFLRFPPAVMKLLARYKVTPSFAEGAVFILAAASCYAPISFAFSRLKLVPSLQQAVKRRVERRLASANLSFAATGELYAVTREIANLAAAVQADFPQNSLKSIQTFVETHKRELLVSTQKLDRVIAIEMARAIDDRNNLELASNLHERAMNIFLDAARYVNRTGSIPLIKDLESNHTALVNHEVKGLLTQRKWDEFHEVVNSIIPELERLKALAIRYERHQNRGDNF